jgi:hypothetical protein
MHTKLSFVVLLLSGSCYWTSTVAVGPEGEPGSKEVLHLRLCDDAGVCIDPGMLIFVVDVDTGPARTLSPSDVARTSNLQDQLAEQFPDFSSWDIPCEVTSNNVFLCRPVERPR